MGTIGAFYHKNTSKMSMKLEGQVWISYPCVEGQSHGGSLYLDLIVGQDQPTPYLTIRNMFVSAKFNCGVVRDSGDPTVEVYASADSINIAGKFEIKDLTIIVNAYKGYSRQLEDNATTSAPADSKSSLGIATELGGSDAPTPAPDGATSNETTYFLTEVTGVMEFCGGFVAATVVKNTYKDSLLIALKFGNFSITLNEDTGLALTLAGEGYMRMPCDPKLYLNGYNIHAQLTIGFKNMSISWLEGFSVTGDFWSNCNGDVRVEMILKIDSKDVEVGNGLVIQLPDEIRVGGERTTQMVKQGEVSETDAMKPVTQFWVGFTYGDIGLNIYIPFGTFEIIIAPTTFTGLLLSLKKFLNTFFPSPSGSDFEPPETGLLGFLDKIPIPETKVLIRTSADGRKTKYITAFIKIPIGNAFIELAYLGKKELGAKKYDHMLYVGLQTVNGLVSWPNSPAIEDMMNGFLFAMGTPIRVGVRYSPKAIIKVTDYMTWSSMPCDTTYVPKVG
jgi:hypothetical protein